MNDSSLPSARIEAAALPPAGMHSLLNWLDSPPPPSATDELASLHRQLANLRASQATPEQRGSALERLYARSLSTATPLLASLAGAALPIPIPRNTRQLIRSLQLLLRTLAEDFLTTLSDDQPLLARRPPPALLLWRSLHALAQHLLISSLVASPAAVGTWRQLHQTYETARRLELTGNTPEGTASTLQDIYYSAVLLGCAQPASFTSPEVSFIAAYLERFSDGINSTDKSDALTPAAFWIDPERDATAFACARKTAPPQTPLHYFSCTRLAARLTEQLAALEAGASATQLSLPDFAGTPAGRGVLRRLVNYWGEPGKRRYPRRRQNYRAVLCSGLARLWRLFQDGESATAETSNWMITNESPDGYAFMHVSGKTGGLSVGDITAIRTESGKAWQICIVRWALSENQEHLELGLQILATRALPALLALPAHNNDHRLLPVLILPAIRALRSSEMLVIPSAALETLPGTLILVVEKENIKVREVKSTRLDEQNSKIAILSIEPDTAPG
jgi:hypothetical protein